MKKYTRLLSSSFNKRAIVLIILHIFSIFFETIGIALIPLFLSIIIDPSTIELIPFDFIESFLTATDQKNIIIYGSSALVILFTFKNIFSMILVWYEATFQADLNYYMRKLFFSLYIKSPYQLINRYNSSDIIRNVDSETQDYVSNFILIIKSSKDFLLFIAIFSLLFLVDPLSTLLVISLLLLLLISYFMIFKKILKNIGEKLLISKSNLFRWINQSLGSIKEVKVSKKENFVLGKFLKHVGVFEKSKKIRNIIQGLPGLIFELVFVLIALTIVIVVSSVENIKTIGVLILYVVAGIRILPILSKFGSYVTNLRASYPSVLHLNSEFDKLKQYQENTITNFKKEKTPLINFEKKIVIKNVNFTYDETDLKILKNININIGKGQVVAFVGQSGSGKTTLINLVCGLLKLKEGSIEVDSKKIISDSEEWQKKIGLLSQENYLIDDTIKNNIIFLNEDKEINSENLNNAIIFSGLKDLIEDLPDGLDTFVGEKGNFLSGGQIKRLALSRLIYRDPEIFILDEFTNSLDFEIEDHILNSIKELQVKKNKTVIMITHKMKPLGICDNIFVVKKGAVVEELSYNEFYSKFSSLYN